jgi:biotin transport system substrate-specific component
MENEKISIVENNKKMTTKKLILCGLFTALIAVGAFIKIPIPVLPFTLQFLFTMMAGLLLGGEMGAYSVFMYILLGLIGLPIFTEGGGLGYIFKPTFGYIIGFCIASYVTGKIANEKSNPTYTRILSANFIGLAIVYSLGIIYYYIICNFVINTPIGVWPLFLYCFILAVPGDILLCILSALLYKRLIPAIKFIR